MRAVAITLVAIGGAVGLWAICSQLPTDAISMGVGLIFGVLIGIALMRLPKREQTQDAEYPGPATAYAHGYSEGYAAGRRLANTTTPVAYTSARPFALVDGEVKP